MNRDQIKAQQTYRTKGGMLVYVQDLNGQKVTFCEVGDSDRREASLGRFASRIASEARNQ